MAVNPIITRPFPSFNHVGAFVSNTNIFSWASANLAQTARHFSSHSPHRCSSASEAGPSRAWDQKFSADGKCRSVSMDMHGNAWKCKVSGLLRFFLANHSSVNWWIVSLEWETYQHQLKCKETRILVGGFNPYEKYESQLGWWHSHDMEK